jgi:hypothetical protein
VNLEEVFNPTIEGYDQSRSLASVGIIGVTGHQAKSIPTLSLCLDLVCMGRTNELSLAAHCNTASSLS